jgi:nitrous oxide reductase accessory protein NosL
MSRITTTTTDVPTIDRRTLLCGLAGGAATALTGCLSGGSGGDCTHPTDPDPVALGGGKQCDECGMVIARHPGPVGQIAYCDASPQDHANPAWFDALDPCLFDYYFAKREAGWEPTAIYVTDYSTVEPSVSRADGRQVVAAYVGADAFGPAREMTYVVDSGVEGAMGPAIVPFSDRSDAAAFRDGYGGELLTFEDITPAVVRG